MKIAYISIMIALLLVVGVSAAQNNVSENMQGNTTATPEPVLIKEQNQTQAKVANMEAVKEQLQEKQQAMNEEVQSMNKKEQVAYKNQNEVRLAVHTLNALGNMTGASGQKIMTLAKEFNNSIQATIKAEEQIQKKSGFARFFSGGDKKAAESLEQEATKNQERIQELKQAQAACDCDEEVKTMLQEQIMNLEKEQLRTQELAAKEQQKKGLLGWIWK